MANINSSLTQILSVDGAVIAAIVDSSSGMVLGNAGSGMDIELAAAGNTEVVRAKKRILTALNLQDDIDDILITLGKQYHIIRPVAKKTDVFIYVVLDRTKANLALARRKVLEVEAQIDF